MTQTVVFFRGGTKHGTTATHNIPDGLDLLFDHPWQPHEHYRRTTETVMIDGIAATVFQIDPDSPAV